MAKPFRLLDDFQAQYVKFNGREPRTLEELAIALANSEHRRRLAEIKAMSKRLALLDELLPALAERGVKLLSNSIGSYDQGKTLRITSSVFGPDQKLFDALIALGFKEVERKDLFREQQTVTLQHGRWLRVSIDVEKDAAPAATETAGSVS